MFWGVPGAPQALLFCWAACALLPAPLFSGSPDSEDYSSCAFFDLWSKEGCPLWGLGLSAPTAVSVCEQGPVFASRLKSVRPCPHTGRGRRGEGAGPGEAVPAPPPGTQSAYLSQRDLPSPEVCAGGLSPPTPEEERPLIVHD